MSEQADDSQRIVQQLTALKNEFDNQRIVAINRSLDRLTLRSYVNELGAVLEREKLILQPTR